MIFFINRQNSCTKNKLWEENGRGRGTSLDTVHFNFSYDKNSRNNEMLFKIRGFKKEEKKLNWTPCYKLIQQQIFQQILITKLKDNPHTYSHNLLLCLWNEQKGNTILTIVNIVIYTRQ